MFATTVQQQQSSKKANATGSQRNSRGVAIQAKLTIGRPNDKYEQEADRIADRVMRMPDRSGLQRKCMDCEKEEKIQQKPLAVGITPRVQRLAAYGHHMESDNSKIIWRGDTDLYGWGNPGSSCFGEKTYGVNPNSLSTMDPLKYCNAENMPGYGSRGWRFNIKDGVTPEEISGNNVQNQESEKEKIIQPKYFAPESPAPGASLESRLNSSGSPLPDNTRSFMEQRIGADFSNVKIHTGSNAVQMSQELGAQAFTHGNHIYFNSGKYSPESASGKHLLAHEMVHTVHQRGDVLQQRKNLVQRKRNQPKCRRMKRPKFSRVVANYPPNTTPSTCAIRMSQALFYAYEGYSRRKLKTCFKNSGKNYFKKKNLILIRGSQDMAATLVKIWGKRDFGWSRPGSPPKRIKGKKGLICYMNIPEYNGQGHIDLWNINKPVGESYWDANPIWFWELKK